MASYSYGYGVKAVNRISTVVSTHSNQPAPNKRARQESKQIRLKTEESKQIRLKTAVLNHKEGHPAEGHTRPGMEFSALLVPNKSLVLILPRAASAGQRPDSLLCQGHQ